MFFYETKIIRYSLIFIFCVGWIFQPGRCDAGVSKQAGPIIIASEKRMVENLFVEKKEEVSLSTTLLLDFTLPGGGHFYRGDYLTGSAFLALKIAGGFMAYYFVTNWKEAEESYNDSKSAGVSTEELENERRRYDKSAQYVTFTVALNVLVYGVSALINYNSVTKRNEKAFPTLNISLTGGNVYSGEQRLNCEVSMRIK